MEETIGEARIRIEGVEMTTIVVFVGEGAPTLLGAYTLEGALLVVDPVRQRLVPTHALRMGLTVIDEDDVVRRANAAANPPHFQPGLARGPTVARFGLSYINQQ